MQQKKKKKKKEKKKKASLYTWVISNVSLYGTIDEWVYIISYLDLIILLLKMMIITFPVIRLYINRV